MNNNDIINYHHMHQEQNIANNQILLMITPAIKVTLV